VHLEMMSLILGTLNGGILKVHHNHLNGIGFLTMPADNNKILGLHWQLIMNLVSF